MLNYYDYLTKRLRKHKVSMSHIERAVANAAVTNGAPGRFNVLVFFKDECYHCICNFNKAKRYNIENLTCKKHNLQAVSKDERISEMDAKLYDSALPEFDLISDTPVYVSGKFVDLKSVEYALQQKYGSVIPLQIDVDSKVELGTNFISSIARESFRISVNNLQLPKVIGSGLEIFLPNDNTTLDSPFWKESKWRDVIPDECSKCTLGETECFYIKMMFEVDGFNNVFFKSDDENGHIRYGFLNAPFGKPEPTSPASAEVSPKPRPTPKAKTTSKPQAKPSEKNQNKPKQVQQSNPNGDLGSSRFVWSETEPIPPSPVYKKIVTDKGTYVEFRDEKIEAGEKMIPENGRFSYTDIFHSYVADAEALLIVDPYMIENYQIRNLENFIYTVINLQSSYPDLRKLSEVHLVTALASTKSKKADTSELKQQVDKEQKELLQKLAVKLRNDGVSFTWDFNFVKHDRCVRFSNGWWINLGRGLDIFKRTSNPNFIRNKDTTIIVEFGKAAQGIPERNFVRELPSKKS